MMVPNEMKRMELFMKSILLSLALLTQQALTPALGQTAVSDASAISALPVAVSVAAPVMLLSGGVMLAVVSVEASARGTVWVLERASDGARVSVRFAGKVLGGAALSVGTAVAVTAIGSGVVLSAAGQAIAFIPNEIGASLLHNEKITK